MKKGFLGELEKEIQEKQLQTKKEFLDVVNRLRAKHNACPFTINSTIIETWKRELGLSFKEGNRK